MINGTIHEITIHNPNRKAHFKKERFALNFLTPQNASEFAIFLEKENPHSFFIFHFEQFYKKRLSMNSANCEA